MKKLLIGLLGLGSYTVFANDYATYSIKCDLSGSTQTVESSLERFKKKITFEIKTTNIVGSESLINTRFENFRTIEKVSVTKKECRKINRSGGKCKEELRGFFVDLVQDLKFTPITLNNAELNVPYEVDSWSRDLSVEINPVSFDTASRIVNTLSGRLDYKIPSGITELNKVGFDRYQIHHDFPNENGRSFHFEISCKRIVESPDSENYGATNWNYSDYKKYTTYISIKP